MTQLDKRKATRQKAQETGRTKAHTEVMRQNNNQEQYIRFEKCEQRQQNRQRRKNNEKTTYEPVQSPPPSQIRVPPRHNVP
jgi:3-hydroxy-3-methylglutaryl CoA synthase